MHLSRLEKVLIVAFVLFGCLIIGTVAISIMRLDSGDTEPAQADLPVAAVVEALSAPQDTPTITPTSSSNSTATPRNIPTPRPTATATRVIQAGASAAETAAEMSTPAPVIDYLEIQRATVRPYVTAVLFPMADYGEGMATCLKLLPYLEMPGRQAQFDSGKNKAAEAYAQLQQVTPPPTLVAYHAKMLQVFDNCQQVIMPYQSDHEHFFDAAEIDRLASHFQQLDVCAKSPMPLLDELQPVLDLLQPTATAMPASSADCQSAVQRYLDEIQPARREFRDAYQVASVSPRISLPSSIQNMQHALRTFEAVPPPNCAVNQVRQLQRAYQLAIDGFLTFAGSTSDSAGLEQITQGLATFESAYDQLSIMAGRSSQR